MLSKEVRTKMKTKTVVTVNGRQWQVRKERTYTHTAYNVGSGWLEPTTTRQENEYKRLQLPSVNVTAVHRTLKSVDGSDVITHIVRTTTGDYATVCEYLGESFLSMANVVSLAHHAGIRHEFTL